MSEPKRRDTPVAPAPPSSSRVATGGEGRLLAGRITLVTPFEERHLESEVVIVGRAADAHVRVFDPLVSRHHVRITVADSAVIIEDLRSANGAYVNGARIHRSRPLAEGDRILIGTTELSVFTAPDPESQPMKPKTRRTELRNMGASGQRGVHDDAGERLGERNESATTARASAFDVLGRLADRLLAMGRAAEAERALSEHLTRLMGGARAGLSVPEDVRERAAGYALRLAQATRRAVWADYAVELYMLAEEALPDTLLERLMTSVPGADLDAALLADYVAVLQRTLPTLSDDARRRYSRLATFMHMLG